MPLSERIRSALAMTIWHSSSSSSSLSDADENVVNSPNTSPLASRGRTPTSASASSTVSIIAVPAHRLKNKFSDLRGKQHRKQLRYNEALVQWAQADEREWLYPTWGGPAKKSRKFSREQRDSLRSWGWNQRSHRVYQVPHLNAVRPDQACAAKSPLVHHGKTCFFIHKHPLQSLCSLPLVGMKAHLSFQVEMKDLPPCMETQNHVYIHNLYLLNQKCGLERYERYENMNKEITRM
ncbi:hypothetical protein GcC1_040024 [Golovinomyces cichoracearum]|uniref:Uncharacterized protein n=1 Tax=Golovinomyces cichoracearum TaxID=62708 RepID=A0A420IZS3_9PEZI|nr:hypothetical protein GcC1_040024 [Golovinomyces cichoracearum]